MIVMSSITLKTITPIHIGSGEFLQNNADFVAYKRGEDAFISVVDSRKILNLIGEEHIQDWLISIENRKESVAEFVRRYCKSITPSDYALRTIDNFSSVNQSDTLKECMVNGIGLYYIPGSSIKGAIRTSVLTSLAKGERLGLKIRNRHNNINAKQVEKDFFGKDPNSDIFRFLRVGDAYFTDSCGIAMRMVNLNIRKQENLLDFSKKQLVEAIASDCSTTFQLKLDDSYYHWVKKLKPESVAKMPAVMESLFTLFMTINQCSRELVESEINFWSDLDNYYGAEDYIESMQLVLDEINKCEEGNECVLRIGHGSGWRFITGAWAEKLSRNDFEDVKNVARPKNYKYHEYVFPKSRRVDEEGDILGFVKLTRNN